MFESFIDATDPDHRFFIGRHKKNVRLTATCWHSRSSWNACPTSASSFAGPLLRVQHNYIPINSDGSPPHTPPP